MANGFLIRAVVGICGLVWLGSLVVADTVDASRALLAPYSLVVIVAGGLVWTFEKWAWAWWPFSLIVKRPDLRGTWTGEILSEWVDPQTGSKVPPIPAVVCISQTAASVHVRQFTRESMSLTVAASLLAEADEAHSVAVVYRNEPQSLVRHRSQIHMGGMCLRLEGEDALSGDYWTDRNTRGQLTLRRVSRRKVRSFAEGQQL